MTRKRIEKTKRRQKAPNLRHSSGRKHHSGWEELLTLKTVERGESSRNPNIFISNTKFVIVSRSKG